MPKVFDDYVAPPDNLWTDPPDYRPLSAAMAALRTMAFWDKLKAEFEAIDYDQLQDFTMGLKSEDLQPWEEDYLTLDEDSNIVQTMLEINPDYLEEDPRIQYYMRKAYIAGELSTVDFLIENPDIVDERGEIVKADHRFTRLQDYLDRPAKEAKDAKA